MSKAADPRIPIDDHVLFRKGPFDGQKFRVPFGKPRTIECAIAVGNQTAIYTPVLNGNPFHFEFVEIVETVKRLPGQEFR